MLPVISSFSQKIKQWWFPALFIFVAVLCWGTTWKILLQSRSVLGITTDLNSSQIIALTNLRREEAGLVPLTPNESLEIAAQQKLADMLARGYFDHLDPAGVGSWQFIDKTDYHYYFAGENLARNFNSSVAVVDAWMASRHHRDNMLNPNYTNIGVAVGPPGDNRYIVQIFATPQPADATETINQDRPFSYSVPLIGSDDWSDNYFYSSMIVSLALVMTTGLIAWPIGKAVARKLIRQTVP